MMRLGLPPCFSVRFVGIGPGRASPSDQVAQAKATSEELAKLGDLLDIPAASLTAEIGENWFPRRGLGPVPPQDPLLYRLYEVGAHSAPPTCDI